MTIVRVVTLVRVVIVVTLVTVVIVVTVVTVMTTVTVVTVVTVVRVGIVITVIRKEETKFLKKKNVMKKNMNGQKASDENSKTFLTN